MHDYYRSNIYYKILDSIIVNLKKRFSPDSLTLAVSVDKFMQLQYEGSLIFIDNYKVLFILYLILIYIKHINIYIYISYLYFEINVYNE